MGNADELRSRLPRLAGEMSAALTDALPKIRQLTGINPKRLADGTPVTPEIVAAYRAGLGDALKLLAAASEANNRFLSWGKEVIAQEIDHCGLTAQERADLEQLGSKR